MEIITIKNPTISSKTIAEWSSVPKRRFVTPETTTPTNKKKKRYDTVNQ